MYRRFLNLCSWIPWELRYLFTPWRWFGEWGLTDLYAWTDEEGRRWIIAQGLVHCLMELGADFDAELAPNRRHVVFRIGSYQWAWVKVPGNPWYFGGFRNWART
jgi:hypothetical protein